MAGPSLGRLEVVLFFAVSLGLLIGAAGMMIEYVALKENAENVFAVHSGHPEDVMSIEPWVTSASFANLLAMLIIGAASLSLAALHFTKFRTLTLTKVGRTVGAGVIGLALAVLVQRGAGWESSSHSWQVAMLPALIAVACAAAVNARGVQRILIGASAASLIASIWQGALRQPYSAAPPGYLPNEAIQSLFVAGALAILAASLLMRLKQDLKPLIAEARPARM